MKITLLKAAAPHDRDRAYLEVDGVIRRAPVHVIHDLPHLVVESLLAIPDGLWAELAAGSHAAPTWAATARHPSRQKLGRIVSVAAVPGIGQVARDGDFAFTLRSWICGAQAAAAVAGSDGFGETLPAGTVECIATITVTDDKAQAQTFFDDAQFAYDAKGRQFSADDNGSIYLAGDQDGTQLNPGVTITAEVPYQVPAGTMIIRLVLHDSDFSDGVTVRVGS